MSVKPADQTVRRAVSDILSVFVSKDEQGDGALAALRQQVYQVLRPDRVDVSALSGLLGKSSDLALKEQNRFLYLEPIVDAGILPFLTLQTSHEWVHFRAYVLLTMFDEDDALQALAIRFETDEGGPESNGEIGSHDFCHAQLCRSVSSRTRATTPNWLPDSQPSFPLDAEDQIELVLCMLTSLYGGRHVVERLNATGDLGLRRRRSRVRALAPIDGQN